MTERPAAPYPDGTPDYWAKTVLDQGIRGEGWKSTLSDGDFVFYSGLWQTIHGPATAVRSDNGAHSVWGALLPDGRRVHCRRSGEPGHRHLGPWRRRSDDGRSWVVGRIAFSSDEIRFVDGLRLDPLDLDENVFERAMSGEQSFRRALRDDSFACSLRTDLRVEGLCTLDGKIGWNPSWGDAAETIVKLRGFYENWSDFKSGGPYPEPPPTDRSILLATLEEAGWRYQTDEEFARFFPEGVRVPD